MVAWEKGRPLRAKLFMAEGGFNCDRLRIEPSEFHKSQDVTRLYIKVSCYADGMSVVIMGAEI